MRLPSPAALVVLAGIGAALHVGKLAPALPVLRESMDISLVQAGFLLSRACESLGFLMASRCRHRR